MRTTWLIYNEFESVRNKDNIEKYFKACDELDVVLDLLIYEKITCTKKGIEYDGKTIDRPDFAIVRVIAPKLSKHLEKMGIHIYNNAYVSEICNDKMKTYSLMKKLGIPVMNTRLFKEETKPFPYPFVLKSVDGKGGQEVFLINSDDELILSKSVLNGKKCIMQEVASDLGKDLRVFVIGKKIICSIIRISETNFKSNHCLGGMVFPYVLKDYEIEIIEKIISAFDFGMVGIDFIFSNGKIVLNEIEDVVGARMVYETTKINITYEYLCYILETESAKETWE